MADWISIGFFIANLGFTAFNARIAGLAWMRQRDSDLPVLSVTAEAPSNAAFVRFNIEVTNKSAVRWHVADARVRRPLGARMLSEFDVPTLTGPAGDVKRDYGQIDRSKLNAIANMRLRLEPAGTKGTFLHIGTGDRHREVLLIFLPGKKQRRRRKVSLYLRLESSEPVPRRVSRTITRVLQIDTSVKSA